MRYEEQEDMRNIHLKKVEPYISVVRAVKYYISEASESKRMIAVILRNGAVEGEGERVEASAQSGEWRNILEGINQVLDATVSHLDNVPAPVTLIDREFTVRYLNDAGAAMVGLTPEEAVGRKCYDLRS